MTRGVERWSDARSIKIIEIAAKYRIHLRRGSNRCPFPEHEDINPSFLLNEDRNTFKCFGCGKAGSAIDFMAALSGLTPSQSVDLLLSDHRGWSPPIRLSPTAFRPAFAANSAVYEQLLALSPLKPSGAEYLANRGISADTTELFRVGQVGSSEHLLRQLMRSWPITELAKAGLLIGDGDASRLVFSSGRLLFPFLESGKTMYIQSRSPIDREGGTRWIGLKGVPKPIYNTSAVSANNVYICEGVMDVLSAHELGLSALGLLGAAEVLSAPVAKSLRQKFVFVVGDRDEAGERLNKNLADQLSNFNINFKIQRVPIGNDINDYLRYIRRRDGKSVCGDTSTH